MPGFMQVVSGLCSRAFLRNRDPSTNDMASAEQYEEMLPWQCEAFPRRILRQHKEKKSYFPTWEFQACLNVPRWHANEGDGYFPDTSLTWLAERDNMRPSPTSTLHSVKNWNNLEHFNLQLPEPYAIFWKNWIFSHVFGYWTETPWCLNAAAYRKE